MRNLKHPATVIALVALFAALSGGAGATLSGFISGSQIKNGSITLNKLAPSAINALQIRGAARSDGGSSTDCPLNTTGTPTFCGNAVKAKLDKKTIVLVNGDLDLASSNGSQIAANLGVCYAPHGSPNLTMVERVEPVFTAPADSYFAQGVTGVVGGLSGTYDVGVCLSQETGNTANGHFAFTMVTAETSAGVTKLGPH